MCFSAGVLRICVNRYQRDRVKRQYRRHIDAARVSFWLQPTVNFLPEKTMGFDGFDSVELIMDVEDVFGISIPDKDAEKLHTPGELTAYIVQRIGAGPDGTGCRCTGASAFYRARLLLIEHFHVDRKTVTPGTLVDHFLPTDQPARRDAWRQLEQKLGIRLPKLDHSRRVKNIVGSVGMLLVITGIALAPVLIAHRRLAAVIPLGLICLGALFPLLIRTFFWLHATYVPRGYETVGKLSSLMKGGEIDRLRQKKGGWTRHEVWEFVQWSAARSARIAPASVERDTSWLQLP
jgi:acyl carrier protein